MAMSFQLVIDCADPEPLARFWDTSLNRLPMVSPAGMRTGGTSGCPR